MNDRRSRIFCPIPGDCGQAPRTNATGRQHRKTGEVRLLVTRIDARDGVWVREEDGLEYHLTDEEWRVWARWPRIEWSEVAVDPEEVGVVAEEAATKPVPVEQLAMEFTS